MLQVKTSEGRLMEKLINIVSFYDHLRNHKELFNSRSYVEDSELSKCENLSLRRNCLQLTRLMGLVSCLISLVTSRFLMFP